ncbi:MAG: hypothetical protein JW864_13280 [Spirochaetes bacterium]|nr:hypothetical protein [Spirochaetota bacterium]
MDEFIVVFCTVKDKREAEKIAGHISFKSQEAGITHIIKSVIMPKLKQSSANIC